MQGVIRFLFAEGVKPVEIIRGRGRTPVCDEERSGRTLTPRTEHSIQAVESMVGETDESQWTTMRRLPYVWSNERSSERKKLFIR
jgi:hypothetical protein